MSRARSATGSWAGLRTVLKRFFQRGGDTRAFGSEATSTEVGLAASVAPIADIAAGVRAIAGIAAGVRTEGPDEATPGALGYPMPVAGFGGENNNCCQRGAHRGHCCWRESHRGHCCRREDGRTGRSYARSSRIPHAGCRFRRRERPQGVLAGRNPTEGRRRVRSGRRVRNGRRTRQRGTTAPRVLCSRSQSTCLLRQLLLQT